MSLSEVVTGSARWHVAPCDCRFGMGALPDACVDAVVCDPPYELGFMGKRWDASGIAFNVEVWREAVRTLKPGGHLVAFGGTRTYHRMVCAIEDAGFEIRDCLAWMYGSGFPKSLDVSKAIDKAVGAERTESIWVDRYHDGCTRKELGSAHHAHVVGLAPTANGNSVMLPASPLARAAAGYGTALKPAFEPCILARKPLDGTVAANWMKHGTGALNVDGCRVEMSPEDFAELQAGVEAIRKRGGVMENSWKNSSDLSGANPANVKGRWPANVLLDEQAAAILDAEAGDHPGMSGGGVHRADYAGGMFGSIDCAANARNDNGGPSRFFYTAKASRSERDAGLEDFEPVTAGRATDRDDGTAGLNSPRSGAGRTGGVRNTHPTVKPIDLMRWLVRLVSRPGSLILDPFCGSGSTGIATMLEGDGRRFIGLELDPKHVDIARARIAHVIGGTWEREVTPKAAPARQPSLFDYIGAAK